MNFTISLITCSCANLLLGDMSGYTPFDRMISLVTKNLNAFQDCYTGREAVQSRMIAVGDGGTGSPSRFGEGDGNDQQESLRVLLSLLIKFSVCSCLRSPSATLPHSPPSTQPSGDGILSECLQFYLSNKKSFPLSSSAKANVKNFPQRSRLEAHFLHHLESSTVLAMSCTLNKSESRKSIQKSVFLTLTQVTDALLVQPDGTLTCKDIDPGLLLYIVKAWSALIGTLGAHSMDVDEDSSFFFTESLKSSLVSVIQTSLYLTGHHSILRHTDQGRYEPCQKSHSNRTSRDVLQYKADDVIMPPADPLLLTSATSDVRSHESDSDRVAVRDTSRKDGSAGVCLASDSLNNVCDGYTNRTKRNKEYSDRSNSLQTSDTSPDSVALLSHVVSFYVQLINEFGSAGIECRILNGHSIMTAVLSDSDTLSGITSTIIQSIIASCEEKQNAFDLFDASSRTVEDLYLQKDPNITISTSTRDKKYCIPTFHDVYPLINSLFNRTVVIEEVIQIAFSPGNFIEIQKVLRKMEILLFMIDNSENDISGGKSSLEDSSISPILYFLYKIARSGIATAADRVLSFLIESWEPIQEAFLTIRKIFPLNIMAFNSAQVPSNTHGSNSTSNTPHHHACCAMFLAHFYVKGHVEDIESTIPGRLVMQILYGCLHDDKICSEAATYVTVYKSLPESEPSTHGCVDAEEDLSNYFTNPLSEQSMRAKHVEHETEEMITLMTVAPNDTDMDSLKDARGGNNEIVQSADFEEGWDQISLFLSVLRSRLSSPHPIMIPSHLIPRTDKDLDILISRVVLLRTMH